MTRVSLTGSSIEGNGIDMQRTEADVVPVYHGRTEAGPGHFIECWPSSKLPLSGRAGIMAL